MGLDQNDLVLAYMAMTRVEPGWSFVRASWEDRCTAARAGGFAGIGIVPELYDEERQAGRSDTDLKRMLDDAGVTVSEVEGLELTRRSEREAVARTLDRLLAVADLFAAPRLFVTTAHDVPRDELVEMFAWVCDRAAPLGLRVGVEFMNIPGLTTSLPDAGTALAMVEAAGADNGGVVVDNYHHVNGANDWSQLEALPGERVVGIQIADTAIPRVDDAYLEDTLHHRRAPGEGDSDVVRFVQTMDAIGVSCPYSTEVINDTIAALAPTELGPRIARPTRAVIAAARQLTRSRP
jgi:sugar phosphate isomerase/epimerase